MSWSIERRRSSGPAPAPGQPRPVAWVPWPPAAGLTSPEIAAELGATPEAVRQALRRAGVRRPAGRPPGSATDGPVSHHSRRGRALLATLGAYAGEAGIEPEAWLEAARVEVMARRQSNRTDRRKDRTP